MIEVAVKDSPNLTSEFSPRQSKFLRMFTQMLPACLLIFFKKMAGLREGRVKISRVWGVAYFFSGSREQLMGNVTIFLLILNMLMVNQCFVHAIC